MAWDQRAPLSHRDVLTFGNGERRVGEVESHQLGRELAEEAAGHGAIEERAVVAHDVHQGDGLGGVGRAHDLSGHRRRGEGDLPIKRLGEAKSKQKLRVGIEGWLGQNSKEETG